jgi:hypothetical protein
MLAGFPCCISEDYSCKENSLPERKTGLYRRKYLQDKQIIMKIQRKGQIYK